MWRFVQIQRRPGACQLLLTLAASVGGRSAIKPVLSSLPRSVPKRLAGKAFTPRNCGKFGPGGSRRQGRFLAGREVTTMPEQEPASHQPTAFRPHVLVVDDERIIRNLVHRALARVGFDVTESCNGQAALDLARGDGTFDVVVSDIRMPIMTGLDLLEQLSLDRPELPVILISGSLEASGIQAATALGAFDVLAKPFS